LAPERTAVQNQGSEALRRRIDGGGKSCRACTYNDHVVYPIGVDCSHQAYAPCKLILTRVAQQLSTWAQDDRQFSGINVEAIDQGFCIRIRLRIQSLSRMTVTSEEILEPKDITVPGASDDDWPAGAGLEQTDPAQDKGAHDAFADLRLRDE
jgi:hypothetical protein